MTKLIDNLGLVHAAAPRLRVRVEFWTVSLIVKMVGALPRSTARKAGGILGYMAYLFLGRLRRVGQQNLQMALPELSQGERDEVLRGEYRHLGVQLAEFCLMPGYSAERASDFIRYEGLEHYLEARDRGRGVLVLTGHLGAWELSSFYHSLMGYRMGMVIRRLDNPLIDAMVNRIRCLHGNRVMHKDDFARGLIGEMRAGGTVGILMDTNMTPPQGVFVPFFGVEACTASGMARVARKTGAAVLPGFLLWERGEGRYVLQFGRELEVIATDDQDEDARVNTARFTAEIEGYVRRYPDQWLWMHRRWKTRPPGESGIY